MKRLFVFSFICFICFWGNFTEAQNSWVQTGLNSNIGYNLFSTEDEIFAATYDGVYSTTDDGMPWFSKNPTGYSVYDVIKSGQYLLAATLNGIYRSSDNGDNWGLNLWTRSEYAL